VINLKGILGAVQSDFVVVAPIVSSLSPPSIIILSSFALFTSEFANVIGVIIPLEYRLPLALEDGLLRTAPGKGRCSFRPEPHAEVFAT